MTRTAWDVGTSSRLASGWFAGRMPFTDDACEWVVAELAIALGADIGQAQTLAETIQAGPEYLLGPVSTGWADGFGTPEVAGAGTIVGWGDNDEGEVDVPAGLHGVIAVAAGWYHPRPHGRRQGRRLGGNDCGECDVPHLLSGVTAVAAGYGHSLAVVGGPS
jgi:hypothetical protein